MKNNGSTVRAGDGQPSRVGMLVGTPLNAAPSLIDPEPAIIIVGPTPDRSMDLDATLRVPLDHVHRRQNRCQIARIRHEGEDVIRPRLHQSGSFVLGHARLPAPPLAGHGRAPACCYAGDSVGAVWS